MPAIPSEDESYTLDEEGNRLTSHLSSGHTTDAANRLSEDDAYTYIYDLNGNLIEKAPRQAPLSSWAYTYDAFDQLIAVSRDGLAVERYRYDALGRRTAITTLDGTGSGTTLEDLRLINDGPDRSHDLVADGSGGGTSGGLLKARYSHGGSIDEPLQLEAFTLTGALTGRFTYHTDHLGSVRFLTDASGTIVNEYDYDSYGRPTTSVEATAQPFRYTGREYDEGETVPIC